MAAGALHHARLGNGPLTQQDYDAAGQQVAVEDARGYRTK